MLLSGRILVNVGDVNTYEYANQARFTEGDQLYVYLQLMDFTKDTGNTPSGRRFMPAAGGLLMVTIGNVDNAKTIVKVASQPFTQDPSIWRFQLVPSDNLRGSFTMQLQLNESGVITRGRMDNSLYASPITAAFI